MEFVKELSLSNWELTNSLQGYVQARGKVGEWREAINRLENFENSRDSNGDPQALSPGTENMIATQWATENFEEAMHWYTQENEKDYSNVKDVKNVAAVLSRIPVDEQYQVADWVESQQGQSGWSDQVVMSLGKTLVRSEPTVNTERLVGSISSEADRFKFVTQFVGGATSSSINKLRHSPDSLNRLVEAARLTEANAATLKDVIAGAKWSGM